MNLKKDNPIKFESNWSKESKEIGLVFFNFIMAM